MADGSDAPEPTCGTQEGMYPISGLRLAACPWCYRPAETCCLLAYRRGGRIEFEVMCERCSAAGGQFAAMRQNGLSRWQVLADFGHRGREVAHRRAGQSGEPDAASNHPRE
jgi:hypothetical protein